MLLNPDFRQSHTSRQRDKDINNNNILELDNLMDEQWEVNLQTSDHRSQNTPTVRSKSRHSD